MAIGQRLSLRCFLEGIEVPIISASLNIQMDAPAQCQVQLPATDAIMKLKPRTLVHIFYYDYWGGPSDSLSARPSEASEQQVTTAEEAAMESSTATGDAGNAGLNSSEVSSTTTSTTSEEEGVTEATTSSEVSRPDAGGSTAGPIEGGIPTGDTSGVPPTEDPESWRIYFIGEVTAIQFQKSAMSRSVVLNCMDNSLYWDTCYQYKVNTASLTGNGQANFVGAGTTLFDTFFEEGTSTIVNVVRSQPISQPDLRGLLAGVVALLERVGGVYRRGSRNFSGVNDFFTIAELRLKLVYQITAASEDFSSQRVFSRRAFHFWGRRQAGRLGEISSFREIVNLMNKFIFHNVVPNPICLYESPHTEERTRVRTGQVQLSETDRGRHATSEIDALITMYEQFASRIRSNYENRGAIVASGRGYLSRLRALQTALRRIGAGYTNALVTLATQHAQSASRDVISADTAGGFDNPNGRRAANACDAVVRNLRAARVRFTGEQRSFRRETTTTHHLGNRLNSQIVRPDIYFVSPPRCNVLFPELYSQVQYARQYMQEVTRMRLTVSDEIFGEDILLNNCYYAPDVAIVGERQRSQLGRGARSSGSSEATRDRTLSNAAYARRLMDHELYVGIIPMFERMNEVNIYGNRTDTVTHRGARIPYVARAVNHQFFKHRFTPRTISVSGKFNPSAVCGFPALVLDKHMNSESTRIVTEGYFTQDFFERLWAAGREDAASDADPTEVVSEQDQALQEAWQTLRDNVPTQYLGMITQMSHTVSQQQGQTQYAMQYARTHNENEELLGANNVRVARRAPGRSPTRSTVVAALSEPREGMVGPYHGRITEVETSDRTGEFLLFGTYSADRPRRQQTRVRVGITQSARSYGPEVTVLVGDPNLEVTFRAYRVTEQIDRWTGDYVDVPLEDFIRPPWMSDIWRNDRIGAAYYQFFGVGAITDPMVVAGGGGDQIPESSVSTEAETLDLNAEARNESTSGESTEGALRPNPFTESTDPELRPNPFAEDAGVDSLGNANAASEGATIQSSLTDINVERAVNLLVRIYSSLKHQGLDTHEFIRAYNWRPVATLTEILGSADLEIDERGRVTQGTEGFHSRAFGRGEMGRDLRNLFDPEDSEMRTLLRIRPDNDRDNVLNRLDKRAEKAEVVLAYVTELWESRGLLG